MTEFNGASSRSHESSVRLHYGDLRDAWTRLDTDEKRQDLLNELCTGEYMTQIVPVAAEITFPETVSELEAGTDALDANCKLVDSFACSAAGALLLVVAGEGP